MTDRDAMTRRTKRNTATCTRLFLCYIKRRLRSIRSSIVVKGIIPFFIVVSLVGTLYQLLCPPPQEQTLLLIRQSPPEILLESPSSKVKSKPILVNDLQIFRIKNNKNQNQNEGKIYSDQGSSQPQQQQPQQEPSVHVPFKHLDLIDPTLLVSVSGGEENENENENEEDGYYVPIDTAHRHGNIHMGTWIFVIDTNINKKKNTTVHKNFHILLLKRGAKLVTCPNTWSLVGEHTYRNEEPMATVRRGLTEELGSRFVTELLVDSNTNNNNKTNNKKKVGTIRNMTQFPIYFEQNWENGGRIDRQVTYLWLVELNIDVYVQQQQQQQRSNSKSIPIAATNEKVTRSIVAGTIRKGHNHNNNNSSSSSPPITTTTTTTAKQAPPQQQHQNTTKDNNYQRSVLEELLHLDAEVADHQWITLRELERWMKADADADADYADAEASGRTAVHSQDFCRNSILSLTEFAITRLYQMME